MTFTDIVTVIVRADKDKYLIPSCLTECVSEDDSDMELNNHNHYKDT